MLDKIAKIDHLIKYANDGESKKRRFLDSMHIIVWLAFPWLIYMVVLALVNEINCTLANMGATLITYIVLLSIIRIVANSMENEKNNIAKRNVDFTAEEIASIFEIFLCASAFYFSCSALFGWNSIPAEMAIANLTLYVGFVVSLEDLVRKDDETEQKKKAFIVLKPFYLMNVSLKYAIICGVIFMVVSAASASIRGYQILLALILLLAIVMLIMIRVKKVRLARFGQKVSVIIEHKRVLLLQIGADYVVKEAIEKAVGVTTIELVKVVDDTIDSAKYDVVIVINYLSDNRDNMYLPELRKVQNMLAEDGVIIDPFITRRKKRSFVSAWLGIPRAKVQQYSVEDYLGIFDKQKCAI